MSEVLDDRIFRKDEIDRETKESYKEICQWVRDVCGKKTNWADAFIAVRLDGMSVNLGYYDWYFHTNLTSASEFRLVNGHLFIRSGSYTDSIGGAFYERK